MTQGDNNQEMVATDAAQADQPQDKPIVVFAVDEAAHILNTLTYEDIKRLMATGRR